MGLNNIYKPQSQTDELMSFKCLENMGSVTQITLDQSFKFNDTQSYLYRKYPFSDLYQQNALKCDIDVNQFLKRHDDMQSCSYICTYS